MAGQFDLKFPHNLSPPFFVRKIPNAGSWGSPDDDDDPADARALRIAGDIFAPDDEGSVSVWCIANPLDFMRISLALNANRKNGPILDLYVVAVTPEEFADIRLVHTDGSTDCWWANRLHRNALIEDPGQPLALAWRLVNAKRRFIKLNKTDMKEARNRGLDDGCHAAKTKSSNCSCERVSRWL